MVFDTEMYSNTGGQASKASNIGEVCQFAAAGKEMSKKSLAEIAMSYGYVYVAQIALGANPNQAVKCLAEAPDRDPDHRIRSIYKSLKPELVIARMRYKRLNWL